MAHSAPHPQITLRCVETETGRIARVVNDPFDTQLPVATKARCVADELVRKIEQQYPLRARVVEKESDRRLLLDIGDRHGVTPGVRFKAVDADPSVQVTHVDSDTCTRRS